MQGTFMLNAKNGFNSTSNLNQQGINQQSFQQANKNDKMEIETDYSEQIQAQSILKNVINNNQEKNK